MRPELYERRVNESGAGTGGACLSVRFLFNITVVITPCCNAERV